MSKAYLYSRILNTQEGLGFIYSLGAVFWGVIAFPFSLGWALPTVSELAESWRATHPSQAYKWEAHWQVQDKQKPWTFKMTAWVHLNEEWKIQIYSDSAANIPLMEWVQQAQSFYVNGQKTHSHQASSAFFPLRWSWQLPFSLLNPGVRLSLSKQQGVVSYQVQWANGNILWLKTEPLLPIRMRLITGCEWRWSDFVQNPASPTIAKTWSSQWESYHILGRTDLMVALRTASHVSNILAPSSTDFSTANESLNQEPLRSHQRDILIAWAKACWGLP